jgi:hypothetical protein
MKRFVEGENRSQVTLLPEGLDDCTISLRRRASRGTGPPNRVRAR